MLVYLLIVMEVAAVCVIAGAVLNIAKWFGRSVSHSLQKEGVIFKN
jgi:hypothetical protein